MILINNMLHINFYKSTGLKIAQSEGDTSLLFLNKSSIYQFSQLRNGTLIKKPSTGLL